MINRKFSRNKAKIYWSRTLNMPESQIIINLHTDKRSKIGEQKSRFGIARIQIHNFKLKNWLDKQLDYCLSNLIN